MKKILACLFFVSFALVFLGWTSFAGAEDNKGWKLDVALPEIGLSWKPLSTTLRADVSGLRMVLSHTSKPKFDVYLGRLRQALGSAHTFLRVADLLLQLAGYKGNDAETLIKKVEDRLLEEIRRQFEAQEYETSYQAFLRAENCQKVKDLTCTMREMNASWIAALRGAEKHKKENLYKWLSLATRVGLYWRLLIQKYQQHPDIREWKKILPEIDAGFASLGKTWTNASSIFQAEESGFWGMKKCSYRVTTPFLSNSFQVASDGIGCKHLEKDKQIEDVYKKRIAFQLARALHSKKSAWYRHYTKEACSELKRKYRYIGLSEEAECGLWEGCSGERSDFCGYTGLLYFHHHNPTSVRYFHKGCQNRDALGCLGLAYFHETTAYHHKTKAVSRPVFQKQAMENYERACLLKNAFACRRLADLLARLPHTEQMPKAKRVYALSCKLGDAYSCNKRAAYSTFPSDVSLHFYRKACALWDGKGCFQAGIAAFVVGKVDEAILFLGRACVKKVPNACKRWERVRTLKQSGQLCLQVGQRQFCR